MHSCLRVETWRNLGEGLGYGNLPDEEHLRLKIATSVLATLHRSDEWHLRVAWSTVDHIWRGISDSPVEKPVRGCGH